MILAMCCKEGCQRCTGVYVGIQAVHGGEVHLINYVINVM